MDSRPFLDTPELGLRRTFYYDPVEDRAHIVTTFEVEDEKTRALFNSYDERTPWTGDMHHVASIPLPLFHQLREQGIADDPKRFKAWLNDSDNRVFRTRPGRV